MISLGLGLCGDPLRSGEQISGRSQLVGIQQGSPRSSAEQGAGGICSERSLSPGCVATLNRSLSRQIPSRSPRVGLESHRDPSDLHSSRQGSSKTAALPACTLALSRSLSSRSLTSRSPGAELGSSRDPPAALRSREQTGLPPDSSSGSAERIPLQGFRADSPGLGSSKDHPRGLLQGRGVRGASTEQIPPALAKLGARGVDPTSGSSRIPPPA